eukprot:1158408-Pelagomonas_calceolata.AAC.7
MKLQTYEYLCPCSPSCHVDTSHGQEKVLSELLFTMLKMMLNAYLHAPRTAVPKNLPQYVHSSKAVECRCALLEAAAIQHSKLPTLNLRESIGALSALKLLARTSRQQTHQPSM